MQKGKNVCSEKVEIRLKKKEVKVCVWQVVSEGENEPGHLSSAER